MTENAFHAFARDLQASSPGNRLIAIRLGEVLQRAELPGARLFEVFPQSDMQNGLSFADEDDNLVLERLFMNAT
jgi:hypothetical protein